MKTIRFNEQDSLKEFCQAAISTRLGDISPLPDKLVDHIRHIYRDFIVAYLNMLRQKENKPDGWYPQKWSIDPELADEMRHFFSDYQHITRQFYTLNAQMDRLAAIDEDRQPNLYRHTIEEILR
jgi:hypothetical protein